MLTPNEKYIQAVSEFAKQRNLQVIIVPTSKGPFETGFKEIIDVGPSEWLGLIKNATYVCTDSFHGCVFATLFNKPFRVFDREGTWGDMWSRMQTLVKIIGDDSVVGNANEELDNIIGKNVDYDKANIEKLKQKSLDYLKRALG